MTRAGSLVRATNYHEPSRFNWNVFFVNVSKWLGDKLWNHLWTNHIPQYRKAWFASFPQELSPTEEILVEVKHVYG
jgi:hypothetical protein